MPRRGQGMQDKKMALYDCAKALFAEKGFKDTGVADITQCAGFAVGTFYNYYPSKDALFAEILKRETAQMMREIMAGIDMDGEPAALIRELLALNAQRMMAHPILRQWYDPDVSGRIEKAFRDTDGLSAMDFLYRDFRALVERWQSEGRMRADIPSGTIMALFEAIIRIGYHKEEIGLQHFPEVQERLTDFVLQGLTIKGGII